MKRAFDFFESRPLEDAVDISYLEKKYDAKLPPTFVLFLQSFIFKEITGPLPYYTDEEVGFDNFQPDFETSLRIYMEQGEFYQERGMIPFALSGMHAGGICVGTRDNDVDKIFICRDSSIERYRFISENIFVFIRGLKKNGQS
jgi:hypothetical protein